MRDILKTIPSCSSADVVRDLLKSGGEEIPHGAKSKLAKHLSCHPSYLGQVLSSKVLLSLDQAMLIANWAQFSTLETELFLNLILLERAGVASLKDFYSQKLKSLLVESDQISPHLTKRKEISQEQVMEYCSSWSLQMVHACLQLNGVRTEQQLVKLTGLASTVVSESLLRIQDMHLVKKTKEGWAVLEKNMHFSNNRAAQNHFHITWRLASANSIATNFHEKPVDDLRFSSLIIATSKERKALKKKIIDLISETSKEVSTASPEEVSVLNIDLFKIKNSF